MTEQLQRNDHEVEEALKRLGSWRKADRASAEAAIEQMGPAAVDALLKALEEEARTKKRRLTLYVVLVSSYVLLIVSLSVFGHTKDVGSFTGVFAAFGGLLAASTRQKEAARSLAKYDDLRGVGFLTEALEWGDKAVRTAALDALTRLLPRLSASQAAYLSAEQRKVLHKVLARGREGDLCLSVLKALEQVGDEHDLPVVEKLASGEHQTKDARLRPAAEACLPFLRESAERQRAASTLLRAATGPDDPAEVLVRPAQGASSADGELLLRPSEAGTGGDGHA